MNNSTGHGTKEESSEENAGHRVVRENHIR